MSATMSDTELKARHAGMWASGDYPGMVETFLLPLGPRLVTACGIGPGMRVLDVAAGTGNASLPAAAAGAGRRFPFAGRGGVGGGCLRAAFAVRVRLLGRIIGRTGHRASAATTGGASTFAHAASGMGAIGC